MNYLIAIDGGGTKTESVLFTCSGIVLSRYITKGVNALDVGIEKSKKRIIDSINHTLLWNGLLWRTTFVMV